jgi:transcriptional regulator with XRE-family HTH domain
MMREHNLADPRTATIRHLRETAQARVENTSLRSVAREIGMSPTGLKKFLQGTAPYSPTLRRLRNWYVHYAAVQSGEVQTQDATAALAVLVHDLSPDPRKAAASCVLECVTRGYDESGKARPVWINELRAHYEAA